MSLKEEKHVTKRIRKTTLSQFPPHHAKICKPTKFHYCQCHLPQLTDVKKNTFQAALEALPFTFIHHLFIVCLFVVLLGFFDSGSQNKQSLFCVRLVTVFEVLSYPAWIWYYI